MATSQLSSVCRFVSLLSEVRRKRNDACLIEPQAQLSLHKRGATIRCLIWWKSSTPSTLQAYIEAFGNSRFADLEYFIFDELSDDFMDSNNHFS